MKKINLIILTLVLSISLNLTTNAAVKNNKSNVKAPASIQKQAKPATEVLYEPVNSLAVVANPTKYLNKKIKIRAQFDKFSTLGLDYKPAYKNSEKYITFLIKREDVINHTVPLSEMKNFIERKTAEKYIDLKPGDDIEYYGTVFSCALGDVWIDVDKFVVLNQKAKEKSSEKK